MITNLTKKDISDLNHQYLPRLTIKNSDIYLKRSQKKSAKTRAKLSCELDIVYGDSPDQSLDVFPAQKENAPVHIFIHGGYWRAIEIQKETYSHIAEPLTKAGASVVIPNYSLCPNVSITTIVIQMRQVIKWVHKNIHCYNGDRKKIFVSGHSAGGHLTAMMATTGWSQEDKLSKNLIKGIAPLSGLFDIEPHRHLPLLQSDLKLTASEAKAMSPMYLAPNFSGTAIIAVGELEPDLFHWQSLSYAAHLRKHRIKTTYISTPNDNHFSITDRLGNSRDPLTRALISQMDL